MDNVMDLSAFQLVDAMNDMDMIRMSNEQQQQQQQRQQSNQQQQTQQLQHNIQDSIELLLNQSNTNAYMTYNKSNDGSQIINSPHYRTTPSSVSQNECYDHQEDIFTPLISPAITPSFSYRVHSHAKDVDFPPLSSPAILPQADQHGKRRSAFHQKQMIDTSSTTDNADYDSLSANQIREQYEQLEHAKMLITQKLSELQKTKVQFQRDVNYYASSSNQIHNTATLSQQQRMPNTDVRNMNSATSLSKPASPSQSPHIEPATPASLMNMKTTSSSPFKLQYSTSSASSSNNAYKSVFQSPTTTSFMESPLALPSMNSSMTLPSPLTLQPRNPKPAREKPVRVKKARRDTAESKTGMHSSPRALKPLLISPTLNPGKPTPSGVSTVEDAERILATRSNYQNLMEGKGAALGIAFDTQIKSGIEVRRTAHKAAEQKRRDSLKEWFDRLRREVEEGYVKRQKSLMSQVMEAQELEKDDEDAVEGTMKPLSKVLLLQYAYEYIASLKATLEERESTINTLLREKEGDQVKSLKRKQKDIQYSGSDNEQDHDEEGQI